MDGLLIECFSAAATWIPGNATCSIVQATSDSFGYAATWAGRTTRDGKVMEDRHARPPCGRSGTNAIRSFFSAPPALRMSPAKVQDNPRARFMDEPVPAAARDDTQAMLRDEHGLPSPGMMMAMTQGRVFARHEIDSPARLRDGQCRMAQG